MGDITDANRVPIEKLVVERLLRLDCTVYIVVLELHPDRAIRVLLNVDAANFAEAAADRGNLVFDVHEKGWIPL